MMVKITGYKIDLDKAVNEIVSKNYQTVALQIPEGLKRDIWDFVQIFEHKTNATILVSADPCFGSCDIPYNKMKDLNVDFIVHIGHTPIPSLNNTSIPTTILNAYSTIDVSPTIEKSLSYLEGKKIGVVTTAQHIHLLPTIKKKLKENNFTPLLSKGDKRIYHNGQILGCNFTAATAIANKTDSFLFIGSGTFHPLGLLLSCKKPVIAADPYTKTIQKKELEELKDSVLRQRYGAIALSKNAKRYGIIIGLKQGQQRLQTAYQIKKLLHAHNKKSLFIAQDQFSPTNLQGFDKIDCYVSTACPRIAIDDYLQYKIPIITPIELEIILGEKQWQDYRFDEIYE
ncbi:MAG: diphthamide biosynthesis enzyme Dph2 [Thermoplasmatota archaeon]